MLTLTSSSPPPHPCPSLQMASPCAPLLLRPPRPHSTPPLAQWTGPTLTCVSNASSAPWTCCHHWIQGHCRLAPGPSSRLLWASVYLPLCPHPQPILQPEGIFKFTLSNCLPKNLLRASQCTLDKGQIQPAACFVNKLSLEHSHTRLFTVFIVLATTAEFSSCNKNLMIRKI